MDTYEKKYKEALQKIRELIERGRGNGWTIITYEKVFEEIFPELKGSEDERIRKALIKAISRTHKGNKLFGTDVTREEALAWLEKQGKQPSAIRWCDVSLIPQEMEELLVEWDSEDATWHEIAFYHADTKTFWNGTSQVENVTRWCYIIDLLEKQEAQILANSAKTCKDEQKSTETVKWSAQEEYCICELEAMVKEAWGKAENVRNDVTIKKMQELMFFLKTLNPNKKPQRIISAEAKEALYDKPAWSEEDEEHYNACLNYFEEIKPDSVYYKDYLWLKSLKERINV